MTTLTTLVWLKEKMIANMIFSKAFKNDKLVNCT